MTTGYTAIIEERADLTFREFALRCARGMCACVMQRDDPVEDPPQVVASTDHYIESQAQAEARLTELCGLSTAAARVLFDAEVSRVSRENEKYAAEAKEKERRYKAMREKVAAWMPPTAQHEGLRRFMLEQIDMCSRDWTPYEQAVPTSVDTWLQGQIENARKSIAYAAKHQAEEMTRYVERKGWIEALYTSLV